MSNGFFNVPTPVNEVVKSYKPGSPEREELIIAIERLKKSEVDIPMYIGSDEIRTDEKVEMRSPHDLTLILGHYNRGDKKHVEKAISAALEARKEWSQTTWEARAAIFLKAAELLAGPFRAKMNAATMLCQSKNAFQAEIDAACELIDFFRYNARFMTQIYKDQPESSEGVWNRLEYRPLEGFIFAITPFNFTSIAANLPAAPALMGNVVVWKPADSQIYSANVIMELFKVAGLPDGVINLVYTDGPDAGDIVFKHPDFAGLHFTGSTAVFRKLWQEIGSNIANYKTYPRIVGETGGKDFIMAHKSADPIELATAISRGAFEFQGQKCSAASRGYIPSNLWETVINRVKKDVESFKIGSPEDFSNFINAVIDERAFDKIASFIDHARESKDAEIVVGGKYSKEKGYFIHPTVIVAHDPKYKTMCEEIFGPVITLYKYDEKDYEKTLELVDRSSPYALTGSIFARDRYAVIKAVKMLENSAGNFYINDKPTGAVVGQQPFGGARASGTNDKAGAMQNLLRWVSSRTIKETFVPARDYRYPFLD